MLIIYDLIYDLERSGENRSTSEYVRGVFIIDSDNIVRLVQFYPVQIGRNMVEIKRAVMALQTNEKHGVL